MEWMSKSCINWKQVQLWTSIQNKIGIWTYISDTLDTISDLCIQINDEVDTY